MVDESRGVLAADMLVWYHFPVWKTTICLLRAAIDALPENDRRIIVLRHFDDLGNNECAAILGIEPKAASIRYVRALEKLEKKLMELSCFGKGREG